MSIEADWNARQAARTERQRRADRQARRTAWLNRANTAMLHLLLWSVLLGQALDAWAAVQAARGGGGSIKQHPSPPVEPENEWWVGGYPPETLAREIFQKKGDVA